MSGKVQRYKSPFRAMEFSGAEANALVRKADLAIAVEDAITQLGITQKEAAERAGVTPTQINEVVRGRIRSYSTDRLIRIVEALGQEIGFTVSTPEGGDELQPAAHCGAPPSVRALPRPRPRARLRRDGDCQPRC